MNRKRLLQSLVLASAFSSRLLVAGGADQDASRGNPEGGSSRPDLLPALDVSVDRTSVSIGDRVVATYSARLPVGSSLSLEALVTPAPAGETRPAGGAVLEFEKPPAATKKSAREFVEWSQRVTLMPFLAGSVAVPGPHFTFVEPSGASRSLRGPSFDLRVSSRLPKDTQPESLAPKADRPTRIPAHPPAFWIAIGAATLAAAALVWWLLRRRRKTAEAGPAVPALPPGAELLAELARLARQAAGLEGDPRGFYSELTRALKRYLERRLGEPVLEWTTFETLRRLREKGLEPPREAAFAELLAAADRVKFGKGAATREEAKRHLERARLVHDFLEPRFNLAEGPSSAAQLPARERVS
jgi:hypothetical protein